MLKPLDRRGVASFATLALVIGPWVALLFVVWPEAGAGFVVPLWIVFEDLNAVVYLYTLAAGVLLPSLLLLGLHVRVRKRVTFLVAATALALPSSVLAFLAFSLLAPVTDGPSEDTSIGLLRNFVDLWLTLAPPLLGLTLVLWQPAVRLAEPIGADADRLRFLLASAAFPAGLGAVFLSVLVFLQFSRGDGPTAFHVAWALLSSLAFAIFMGLAGFLAGIACLWRQGKRGLSLRASLAIGAMVALGFFWLPLRFGTAGLLIGLPVLAVLGLLGAWLVHRLRRSLGYAALYRDG